MSRLCDRIIEAAWLVALVTVPVMFNVHSYLSFEPDKATLLRSVALVMWLAWGVKGLERLREGRRSAAARPVGEGAMAGTGPGGRLLAAPLVVAALLLFLDHALATAWSIAPRTSLWGSYHRLQGLYTASAYLTIFLSMVALVRTPVQVARAVDAALMASFAVAAYGLLQRVGLDPILWDQAGGNPIRSTLGNELFAASFLIMTVPLAAQRLLAGVHAASGGQPAGRRVALWAVGAGGVAILTASWAAGPAVTTLAALATFGLLAGLARIARTPRRPYVRIGVYAVLLSAQLAAIVLAQRRGPFLGLLAGLVTLALVWALARGRWRAHLAVTGAGALLAIALIAVAASGSRLASARETPIGRITDVLSTEGTARVRLLIWEGATALLAADPVRAVIGHGPETLRLAFAAHHPPALSDGQRPRAVPDRAHNETIDVLVATGVIGFVLYYGLMIALVCAVLQRVGLATAGRPRRSLVAAAVGSALAAAAAARLVDGSWRLVGLAVPFGLLGGIAVSTAVSSLRRILARAPRDAARPPGGILAALGAACVAHFVEIQFGIATVSTLAYFWILAALLVVVAGGRLDAPDPPGGPPETTPVLLPAAVSALVVVTLVFDFSGPGIDVMTERRLFWLLALVFGAGALLLLVEARTGPTAGWRDRWEVIGAGAGTALAAMLVGYVLFRLPASPEAAYHPAVLAYGVLLLASIGLIGALLPGRRPSLSAGMPRAIGYAVACVAAVFLIGARHLDVVQADIWFKRGWLDEHQRGRHDQAVSLYERAVARAPRQDRYHVFLGKALAEQAAGVPGEAERERLLRRAETALLQAARLTPLDPDHPANLARLYAGWARASRDQRLRDARLQAAAAQYRRSTELSPGRPELWREWAATHALMDQPALALEKERRAQALEATAGGGRRHRAAGPDDLGPMLEAYRHAWPQLDSDRCPAGPPGLASWLPRAPGGTASALMPLGAGGCGGLDGSR